MWSSAAAMRCRSASTASSSSPAYPGARRSGGRMSAELLNIGQMLDELREEFPELTISKIRYLEEQGLLAPQRTPAGYRKFSFADVERLRFILRQQANFWPLNEIRQTLDDMDRGLVPDMRKGRGVRVPELQIADDG